MRLSKNKADSLTARALPSPLAHALPRLIQPPRERKVRLDSEACLQPPAIAPIIRNGSLPDVTGSGSGASGDSCVKVFLAGKKPQEGSPFARDLVADRPSQHRIAGLERVEDRSLRDRGVNLKLHLAAHVRQRAKMLRKLDSNGYRHA